MTRVRVLWVLGVAAFGFAATFIEPWWLGVAVGSIGVGLASAILVRQQLARRSRDHPDTNSVER